MASIDDLSFDRPGLRPARPPLPPSLVGSISSVLLHNTSGSDALGPWNSCVTHRMWLSSVFSCPRSRHLGPLRPHACGSYRQTPLIHTTCKIARCNPNIRAQRGPLDLGSSRPPEAEATLIHRPPLCPPLCGRSGEALRSLARPREACAAPQGPARHCEARAPGCSRHGSRSSGSNMGVVFSGWFCGILHRASAANIFVATDWLEAL